MRVPDDARRESFALRLLLAAWVAILVGAAWALVLFLWPGDAQGATWEPTVVIEFHDDGEVWLRSGHFHTPITTTTSSQSVYKRVVAGERLVHAAVDRERPVAAVPEPSTLLLLASGLAGMVTLRRRAGKCA